MVRKFLKKNRVTFIRGVIFLLCFTFLGLFNFVRFVTSELALGNDGRYLFYFIMEMTGVYTYLMLIPFIFMAINKFPITKENLISHIPLHILISMVLGASHTLLMFSSRHLIFWIGDLGKYDYGQLSYRFLMEYSHQAVSYWLWYGGIKFWRLNRKNQEQKIKAAKLQEQLSKVKLQALQMQIQPHFLFNTLNMISSTIYDDVGAADKMIANLSELLRKTLSSSGDNFFPLKKEMEAAELYLEIMRARFGDKLVVNWQVEPELTQAKVPAFILQPILENSIHHGMESLEKLVLQIDFRKIKNRLQISIVDNGPGMSEKNKGQGIGLANISERLEKLYGQQHDFDFGNNDNGGFKVSIAIPFEVAE